jgi:DNA polymerase-3 subunit delta'
MIDDAMTPLAEAQAAEAAEFADLVAARGERGSGRKQFEDRHKREVRRYRTDEIRAGLTELSRRYRDDLATSPRPADTAAAIDDIAALAGNLVRNPNERLQLVALFTTLGRPRR